MVNYQNGKIYTIRCRTDDTLIYVGSTTEKRLSARWGKHKASKRNSMYQYIQNHFHGDWSNWYIELYENYPCENIEELNRREGEIQREIATINKCIAGRTKQEYYYENKDQILEKMKNYQLLNKEQIRENSKVVEKNISNQSLLSWLKMKK